MNTSQAEQHHDTFQLTDVVAKLCTLFEAAGARLDSLFLNADEAFDVSNLRQACARHRHAIQTNFPRNRRAADWHTNEKMQPLDVKIYRRCLVIK